MALATGTLAAIYGRAGMSFGGSTSPNRITPAPAPKPSNPVLNRAGNVLIQKPGDPAVYSVNGDGTYSWIPDEATAAAKFGPDWASGIQQTPDLSKYGTLSGSTPPKPADPLLGSDPEYQQVIAGYNYKDDILQANAEGARNDASMKEAFYRPEIAYQGTLARRAIDTDAEARGVFRSGEHDRSIAEQLHSEQQQGAALGLDTTLANNEVSRGLASDLGDSQISRYQEALAAAQRNYMKQEQAKLAAATY